MSIATDTKQTKKIFYSLFIRASKIKIKSMAYRITARIKKVY